MAITSNTYTGNGSNKLFSITFPYLETSDIDVYLNGTLQTITTQYFFANATTVEFVAAPANGATVKLDRSTDDSDNPATFFPGSSIKAADLNENFDQTLYVVQEINNNAVKLADPLYANKTYIDAADATKVNKSGDTMSGNLAMGGNRVTGLGTPSVDADSATKLYVDQRYGQLGVPGLTRWRKIATAGQTVFSGVGEDSNTLAYSASRESVFINGAYQQRGVDYTANNGTSITITPALLAGDVVDVHCVNNAAGVATDQASGVYFTQSGVGATTRTVDSKLKDIVSVKDFGAVGDGTTNDTAAITAALTYAIANNKILTGANSTYAVQGRVSITDATSTAFSIVDCTFKSIGENNSEYGLFITAVNATVDLQNVIYDGIVDSKYATNKLQWFSQTNAQTGAAFGLSIWPQDSLAAFAVSIQAKNINCQNISMVNSHSCGFRFNCEYLTIDSFFAKNLTFTSAYTAASKGSNINNYFAENVGRNLPASFDVYNPSTSSWAYSTNQSAGYYAQGSFGLRIGGAGQINLNNVYVNNFYTTAIVLDTDSTSNISNIFIESNESVNRTNQVHGAIFYELSQGTTANNVQIVYNQRYSDTTSATTCCMIYCYTEDSDCTFNNIVLEDFRAGSSDTMIKCVDNQNSNYIFSKLIVRNAKTASFKNIIGGVLNYPAQQPGKVLVDGLAVSGNLNVDFRDFKHVFVRGITKDTANLIDVLVGDSQANFSNITLISDSHVSNVYGTGAAAGCQIDNCFINGSINVTNNALGEGAIDVHSSITDSTLNLTATSIFDGTGTKSTLRVANNTITSASNTLNLRTAGMLEFTNNILRYNGAVNCVLSSGLNIVKNLGTTALKGPAATAPVGYSLAGSASTIIGNNDTITFDWT